MIKFVTVISRLRTEQNRFTEHNLLPTEHNRFTEHNLLPTEHNRFTEHNLLPTEHNCLTEHNLLPTEHMSFLSCMTHLPIIMLVQNELSKFKTP
ncbi:hypothetical protein NPIL_400661 [Nephila pilipes]|uniref:Uncharacterized protein n=1 Tax=Nephila pilipes TaxID=299642 RepID=A0A8X6TJR3_NEPPI|nr:hypothetical protein NPIL_400661 [Nephila pilipes]